MQGPAGVEANPYDGHEMSGGAKDEPGPVDDLQDQANWSTSAAHLPRYGNDRREEIQNAGFRRALGNLKPARFRQRSALWRIGLPALWAAGAILAVATLVTLLTQD